MTNNEQFNTVRRFVVIDEGNYEVVARFGTYREAWEYMKEYPSDYVNSMTGEDYDEDGNRIHVDETEVYDRASALEDDLIIVYDKGDDEFEDLPEEQIMLDAIGIDMETRQKYEHCNDWIHGDKHRMWLDELETDYRANS